MKNQFTKITKKELSVILNVSYKTALKEYRTILDSLSITNRTFLTQNDLIKYGLFGM